MPRMSQNTSKTVALQSTLATAEGRQLTVPMNENDIPDTVHRRRTPEHTWAFSVFWFLVSTTAPQVLGTEG